MSKAKIADLRGYLAWLATEYKPQRITSTQEFLSPKTVQNDWISLSVFFRWASTAFGSENPMLPVPAAKFGPKLLQHYARRAIGRGAGAPEGEPGG